MNEIQGKVKMTPADFFLYLGILISLYVSATALIAFLFAVIDIGFPDTQEYYNNPIDNIAWSLSVFIVFFPILIVLLSLAMRGIKKNIEKAQMVIRKWFIFLTLFVTGLTIAIDLIVLINFFLKGEELTIAFFLKVFSIILVAGIIFLFSLKDLKGHFISKDKLFNQFRTITSFVVIIIIITGLFLIGSPSELRNENYDEERVQNLSYIQSEITNFWQSKKRLPENLEELNDPLVGFEVPLDPKTEKSYGYNVINAEKFELCADFETKQDSDKKADFYLIGFEHDKGRVCFERTIDPEKFQTIKMNDVSVPIR